MARKTKTFVGTAGRDTGKRFEITEMSARQGHSWAMRALLALAGSGLDIGDDFMERGMAGLAAVGMRAMAKLPAEVAEPLLNELLACVQMNIAGNVRSLIDDDFEEIETIFMLQWDVLSLHIEPFISGGALTTGSAQTAKQQAA